jgi:hypothetical protein
MVFWAWSQGTGDPDAGGARSLDGLSQTRRFPQQRQEIARTDAGCPVEGSCCWGREIPDRLPNRRQARFCFPVFFNFRETETDAINSPMTASISSPRATGSARAAGSAGRLIHIITMTLFRRGRPRRKKWPRGVGVTHWKRSRRRKFKDFL